MSDENTEEIQIRISPTLKKQIDAYSRQVEAQIIGSGYGGSCSRAEAVRILLRRALHEMAGKGLAKGKR